MRDLSASVVTPRSTTLPSICGSLLCWLALPPVSWHLLAWIAPVPWLLLVQAKQLPGRRPYGALYLAGISYWLLAAHWIRLPHPLNYLGWLALALYMGAYLPLFVALSRMGVHKWRLPLTATAPIVWTGLDWLRAHLFTGFLMASLAHSQYRVPTVIQIADLVGEYGVSFLILLVAASITRSLVALNEQSNARLRRLAVAAGTGLVSLVAALFYGHFQQARYAAAQSASSTRRVALIQGNTLADWKSDPVKQESIMHEYMQLSLAAVKQSLAQDHRTVELVVWPETAFRQALVTCQPGYTPPSERIHETQLTVAQADLAELVRQIDCAALVGIDRLELFPADNQQLQFRLYNSSVLVDRTGKITATYDKMHLVPFGEFIPFAKWFPALYRLTPLSGGAEPGTGATAMYADDLVLSPNICYESAVPHLIRRQLLDLKRAHVRPDALVNLTNDAWFWGSSELDMHLACGVFRAVESHTPWLIAANGGLSAHIDATGRIASVSTRQHPEYLLVDVRKNTPPGRDLPLYIQHGDWFAGACMICCVILAASLLAHLWRLRSHPPAIP